MENNFSKKQTSSFYQDINKKRRGGVYKKKNKQGQIYLEELKISCKVG